MLIKQTNIILSFMSHVTTSMFDSDRNSMQIVAEIIY